MSEYSLLYECGRVLCQGGFVLVWQITVLFGIKIPVPHLHQHSIQYWSHDNRFILNLLNKSNLVRRNKLGRVGRRLYILFIEYSEQNNWQESLDVIGFFSFVFENDFVKNDSHRDLHDTVFVNRDFAKVEKMKSSV